MKKVFLKVISGVSIFMFTVGFATHAYMEANNIKLTKAKTAYAITADANTVIEHAKSYIGWDNATFQNNGKNICQSHWCASWISLCYSDCGIYNPVPEGADIRVEEFAYWFAQHNRLHINPNANISGFTTMYTDNSLSEYELSQYIDYGTPTYGDILLVDWDHNGMPDHVCFYLEHTGNTLITLDGNHPEHEDDDWYDTHVAEVYYDYYDYFNENYLYGWISPFYSYETEEERLEREEREAKEREEANIQSIAESAASLGGNALETFFESINKDTFKVTFDAGDFGYIEKNETTVFRNACPLNDFPPASPYDDSLTFYRWVDYYGKEYTKDSFYEKDITLFAEYTNNEGIIINPHYYEDSNNNWAMNGSFNLGYWTGYPNYGTKEIDVEAKTYNKPNYYEPKTETSVTPEASPQKLGDVNGDGYINAVDSSIILQYTAQLATSGISTLTQEEIIAADVDGDGHITSNDSRLALSYYTYLAVQHDSELMTIEEYIKNA